MAVKINVKANLLIIDKVLIYFFSLTPFLSGVYYLFINRKFQKQQHTVLCGRLAYWKEKSNTYLLRRNIHRLEKGLIMPSRKNIFAENYILETVETYRKILENKVFSEEELKWAKDVLNEYFHIVDSDKSKIILESKKIFCSQTTFIDRDVSPSSLYKPYLYSDLKDNNISYEQLSNLYHKRRSVRWYLDKNISKKDITKAINIATLAPSACNRQSFKFLVITDKKLAIEVARLAGGTSGFSDNIPALIVAIGDLSAYPYERDRNLIYIDTSLATMQLMLALEILNLSSCPINWPLIDSPDEKIRKLLKIKNHQQVIMLLSIGYADPKSGIAFSQKKKNTDITTFNYIKT